MAELTPTSSTCCAPKVQETCCEPAAKESCCGAESAASGCDCSAGQQAASPESVRETVRERYAQAARAAASGQGSCCTGDVLLDDRSGAQVFGDALYDET